MMKQSRVPNLVVFLIFLFGGILNYRFGRSAAWFIVAEMILLPAIIYRIKGDISCAEFLHDFLLSSTLIITGGIQIGSGLTFQDFLSHNKYAIYHSVIYIYWIFALLALALLDFVGTGGAWNSFKFLNSLFRSFKILLLCIALPILLQIQHSQSSSR
jgi:hypothetical protein